jgi:CPA1 family monovalent cation:H+ antiporter
LFARLKLDLDPLHHDSEEMKPGDENALKNYQLIYFELLDGQRRLLNEINHREEFDEGLIRKYLSLIDLEELKLRTKIIQGGDADNNYT